MATIECILKKSKRGEYSGILSVENNTQINYDNWSITVILDTGITITKCRNYTITQIDINTGHTIKIHDGLKIASRDTGVNSGSICKVCKEIRPSAGGFKWKYVD